MNGFVTKPIQSQRLFEVIERLTPANEVPDNSLVER
jgi:FixJ family two-component response regulator